MLEIFNKSQKKMNEKKIVSLLFLLALVPALIYSFVIFRGPALHDDGLEYHAYAVSMLQGRGFVANGLKTHRGPGFPFFLAAVYLLAGQSQKIVVLLQCIMIAACSVLVYKMALKTGGRKTALTAYLMNALSFGVFSMPAEILSEPLFTLLLCLSCYCLCGEEKNRNVLLSGISAGLATLVRPTTLLLPGVTGIWFAFRHGLKSGKTYVKFLVFLAGFACVIAPWTYRNYGVHRALVPVNTQGGEMLWNSNNPWVRGDGIDVPIYHPEAAEKYKDLTETERNSAYMREGLKYIKSLGAAGLVKSLLLKTARLFYVFYPWYDVTFGFIVPFFFYGLWLALRKRKEGLSVPLMLVVYLLFTTLIFYGSPRFRGPFYPAIALVAAAGFMELFVRGRKARIFIGVWVAANAAMLLCAQPLRSFVLRLKRGL